MRCSTHILNLIVQDGLKEIDDSIVKIRESIKYVNGSQARKVKFLECVSLCTLDTTRGLKQDVPTMWNSTFKMLDSAIYYKNAFVHLRLSDSNFKHCPSVEEWVRVENICKFLQVFNDITCLFLGSKYVTANMFFPLVFTAHLTLKENMDGEDSYMSSMANKMMLKFQKYSSAYTTSLAIAVILVTRYKLSFVQHSYKKLYGDNCWPKL
ncbi:hypothetical protein M5689_003428 [Euphorbia peplus]|nr:hypothetical protein M5689_003428 [Euphorbia peplus]